MPLRLADGCESGDLLRCHPERRRGTRRLACHPERRRGTRRPACHPERRRGTRRLACHPERRRGTRRSRGTAVMTTAAPTIFKACGHDRGLGLLSSLRCPSASCRSLDSASLRDAPLGMTTCERSARDDKQKNRGSFEPRFRSFWIETCSYRKRMRRIIGALRLTVKRPLHGCAVYLSFGTSQDSKSNVYTPRSRACGKSAIWCVPNFLFMMRSYSRG
jgi:hypothetical protein